MIFDTHSHLFDEAFDNDREECLIRCAALNMSLMLVGYSHETNIKAYEMAKRSDRYYSTAGIHPAEAKSTYVDDIRILDDFVQKHNVKAIGECGLDYYYNDAPDRNLQKVLFIEQIELAIKYDLPLVIHTREAWADTYEILNRYRGKIRGIMHCYTGSLEMAFEFIKMGFYIAIGGAVTFKNANEAKRVVSNIDLNYLLVETDCPYITPVPYRGKRNESSYIVYTISEIAKIRNMDLEELEKITFANACKIFKI